MPEPCRCPPHAPGTCPACIVHAWVQAHCASDTPRSWVPLWEYPPPRCACTAWQVCAACVQAGVRLPRLNGRRILQAYHAELVAEYQQGASTITLAARYGVGDTAVWRYLQRRGLLRSQQAMQEEVA